MDGSILCCVRLFTSLQLAWHPYEPSPFSGHAHSAMPSLGTIMHYPWKCWLTWRTLSGHWGKWHEGIITMCQPKFLDLLSRGHCSSGRKGFLWRVTRMSPPPQKLPKKIFKRKSKVESQNSKWSFRKEMKVRKGKLRKENMRRKEQESTQKANMSRRGCWRQNLCCNAGACLAVRVILSLHLPGHDTQ